MWTKHAALRSSSGRSGHLPMFNNALPRHSFQFQQRAITTGKGTTLRLLATGSPMWFAWQSHNAVQKTFCFFFWILQGALQCFRELALCIVFLWFKRCTKLMRTCLLIFPASSNVLVLLPNSFLVQVAMCQCANVVPWESSIQLFQHHLSCSYMIICLLSKAILC